MSLRKKLTDLESKIANSYTEDITVEDAEKLAAEFLHAQIMLAQELKKADLNSRMAKSGLKAVQAAAYLEETQGKDKKPTEAAIQHAINTSEVVSQEQDRYDNSEVDKLELERYYDIFANAHIFYRGIAKGRFE